MSNRERTGVIVLAIAGLFALGFGAWSISYKIKSPFFLKDIDISTILTQEDDLIGKDTDLDGLSDFDETAIYKTSPYLEDTDSDGISDYDEIKNDTDPNCPEGKDCNYTTIDTSSALTLPDPVSSDIGLDTIIAENPLINPDGTIRQDLSAQEIREILQVMGISEDELNKLNDTEILSLYKESLKDIQ